jgi:hypothetical protein
MNPEALRAFFRFGLLITLLSLCLVFNLPRDSASFVASVCSLGTGLALLGAVALVARLTQR